MISIQVSFQFPYFIQNERELNSESRPLQFHQIRWERNLQKDEKTPCASSLMATCIQRLGMVRKLRYTNSRSYYLRKRPQNYYKGFYQKFYLIITHSSKTIKGRLTKYGCKYQVSRWIRSTSVGVQSPLPFHGNLVFEASSVQLCLHQSPCWRFIETPL